MSDSLAAVPRERTVGSSSGTDAPWPWLVPRPAMHEAPYRASSQEGDHMHKSLRIMVALPLSLIAASSSVAQDDS